MSEQSNLIAPSMRHTPVAAIVKLVTLLFLFLTTPGRARIRKMPGRALALLMPLDENFLLSH